MDMTIAILSKYNTSHKKYHNVHDILPIPVANE